MANSMDNEGDITASHEASASNSRKFFSLKAIAGKSDYIFVVLDIFYHSYTDVNS